mgnify:CR=1 FL=1
MNNDFYNIHFERKTGSGLSSVKRYGYENAEKVNAFHKSFPEYSVTPLRELKNLAADLGVKSIYVKDESFRFGLNAFKVLGGSYAIGSYIARRLGMDISELPYEKMTSEEIKAKLGETTFVTATDGNHGRGVAWTANRLGQKSVVFMPKGTAPERLENIKKLGSDASITELVYDDDVRLAKECSEKYGWILVQDTAWPGYEEIPKWIMQGYTSMAFEALKQLNGLCPTHIFLQAGVGAMSGAVTAFFSSVFEKSKPVITIVEPNKADCIYQTAKANDGKLRYVTGNLDSIMAGLCCGEPCTLAWDILKDYADNFVSVPDDITKKGMRILAQAAYGDDKVVSGESGAVGVGLLAELMENDNLRSLKEQIGLNENSVVLCFSTEGDTDKDSYRKIILA